MYINHDLVMMKIVDGPWKESIFILNETATTSVIIEFHFPLNKSMSVTDHRRSSPDPRLPEGCSKLVFIYIEQNKEGYFLSLNCLSYNSAY